MGRTLTTSTDLSSYVGQKILISGSDCCWTVVGTTEPDLTVREVTPTFVGCEEYYYYGLSELSLSETIKIIKTF